MTVALVGKSKDFSVADLLQSRKMDSDNLPISEYHQYTDSLLKALIIADDGCRKFIFRHLFAIAFPFFILRKYIDPFNIELDAKRTDKLTPDEIDNLHRLIFTIINDLDQFYFWVLTYCERWGNDIEELLKVCDNDGTLRQEVNEYYKHCRATPQPEEQAKYKTLERTHRIAILKILLDYTGVSKNIDKTKIAGFVEAVTGGNIEVKPQDSISYKKPTKQANGVAVEWLERLNIKIDD